MVRVCEQDGHFSCCECDGPFTVCPDAFAGFGAISHVVDHYIDIPNGLGVASVGVKGIVSCVDVVEVNISVKENISPERIGKVWAVSSYNEVVFGMSDVMR